MEKPAAREKNSWKLHLSCSVTTLQKLGGRRGEFSGFDYQGRVIAHNPVIDPSDLLRMSGLTENKDGDSSRMITDPEPTREEIAADEQILNGEKK